MLFISFKITMLVMLILGTATFITLYFVPAGYGKTISKNWGTSFNNKIAWVLMEMPTLIVMTILFIISPHTEGNEGQHGTRFIVASFFMLHYVQRTLIFPFLLRGKGKMPILIVFLGMLFNTVNTLLIGGWIFYFSPANAYTFSWLLDTRFIIGVLLFIFGMTVNISSDAYIRSLRKDGDSNHYFPKKGFYKYVTSANYFGEILEWTGFALLSWSLASALFVFWTAANLIPRSHTIYKKYKEDFPNEMAETKPKRIFPFIY